MSEKCSPYLGLEGHEWEKLLKSNPESPLIPCCVYVDNLRYTIQLIYTWGITPELAQTFIFQYRMVIKLHRHYDADTLHRLYDNVCVWNSDHMDSPIDYYC